MSKVIYRPADGFVYDAVPETSTVAIGETNTHVTAAGGGEYYIGDANASNAAVVTAETPANTPPDRMRWDGSAIIVTTDPGVPNVPTVFEISPGQLRNRMPWESEAWLETNQRKADSDNTKVQFAAVIWGRIKDSKTINVLSQNVIDLGAAMVALSIPQLDGAAMAICLTPHALPGETRDGLIG